MANEKNFTKKGKGRPKGSINKSMRLVRDILDAKRFDLIDEIIEHYNADEMKSRDKLKVLFKLIEYTYPKLREVSIDEEGNQQAEPVPVALDIAQLMRIAKGDN